MKNLKLYGKERSKQNMHNVLVRASRKLLSAGVSSERRQTKRTKQDRELLQKRKDWVLDKGFGAGKFVKFVNPPPTPNTPSVMSDQEEEERDDGLGLGPTSTEDHP